MKQLKKTLLTLVALLALTTQAWATDVYLVGNGTGNWLNGVAWDPGAAGNKMTEQNGVYSITFTNVAANSELQFKFAINGTWDENYGCTSDTENELNKTLSNIEVFGTNIMFGLTEPADVTISFNPSEMTYMISTKGMKVGDDAPSGPEVAWDKKTGTFTMPGGNVTLEPEYYPQATAAEGAVTAADADARATTDDPLVKVDATKLTGAKKLMYFVSNSGTTAPAYDAEGWTEQLPTAEDITQQGIVYVWYYPVGTDEGDDGATATYSDGNICLESITARIAAEPTYAVTFADGVNPEPPAEPEWTASPAADVKKGQTVTVTYTGTKKVIGVKAEKKAAEPVADIIWDGTNVTDLNVESTYASYTKDGVKLSGNADQVQVKWNNSAYLGTPGMEFITMESGGFTFTAPTGKKFTKIEMKAVGSSGWAQENLGTGWAYNTGTVTWNGSAASTVKLLKDADMFSGDFISSIAFYLSE